jgi:diguanylate cyclase (GGDEF)-like protein/PAS domain S-box-containing protein
VIAFCFLLSNQSVALEKVTLQLKYLHQFQFAGYYAALEQGYYREAGLDVSIKESLSSKKVVEKVLSGAVDFGVGSSNLLLARNEGQPVVVLGVIFQHSPYVLIMPAEKSMNGIQSIAGKRIMIGPQALDLKALLNKENISFDELVKVPHSFNINDLINGKVDVYSGFMTNETDYLDSIGFKYRVFSPNSAGIDFYGDNLFTSERLIKDSPDKVAAFRQASLRGWQYAFEHPDEIIELILTKYSQRNSKKHLEYEARQMLAFVDPILVEVGYMNRAKWESIAKTYADLGMLERNYSLDGFMYDAEEPKSMFWLHAAFTMLLLLLLCFGVYHFISRAQERRKMAEAILFKNILLTKQQEASVEGLLTLDSNDKIISVNQRFMDIWGVDKNELNEGPFTDTLVEKVINPARFVQSIEALSNEIGLTGIKEVELKDGRVFEYYCSALLSDEGRYFGRFWSFRNITERKESDQLIWNRANLDFLTGLPNRYMLFDRLSTQLELAKRSNKKVALLFLDLDKFKEINDSLGHDFGDKVIQETARRLKAVVRNTDIVSRLGGDEFTVVISDLSQAYIIGRIVDQILESISKPYVFQSNSASISTSIGIAIFPDDAANADTLLKNADQAMYAAKEKGRNGYQYFTGQMQDAVSARQSLNYDLKQALDTGELIMHYQPIVNLSTKKIFAAQAMVRWMHPSRGAICPLESMKGTEDVVLVKAITNWVFDKASHHISEWRSLYNEKLQVNINLSTALLTQQESFNKWQDALRDLKLQNGAIIFSVDEGALIEDDGDVFEKLMLLRSLGLNIALDDFGTGFTSLTYLSEGEIAYLKINESFIAQLVVSPKHLILFTAIIEMVHKLDIKVIAEGVATKQQLELIRAAGCDYAQGIAIQCAVGTTEFEKLLFDAQKRVI